MNPFLLLSAIGIVLFVLIVLFNRLGNNDGGSSHYLLQLLVLGFILGCLLLVGKTAVDNQDTCAWNVVNSTTSGSVTSYGYEYQCIENTKNTNNVFFKSIVWFVKIVSIYIVLYFIYELLSYFNVFAGRGEKREED